MAANPKILFIEDDEALARIYQVRLQAEGFDVKWCNNGEQALAQALRYQPDLVLLDIMMPRISGYDVLDILRNTPELGAVKVVALTALSQPEDKAKALGLGADDYMVKSQSSIGDVMDSIRRQLGLPSAV